MSWGTSVMQQLRLFSQPSLKGLSRVRAVAWWGREVCAGVLGRLAQAGACDEPSGTC